MKYILILTLLVLSIYSKDIIIHTSGQYHMNDADTKIDSRKIALEYAKSNAIEEAGILIYSDFNLRSDSTGKHYSKHELQTYSSGIIKTKIIKTQIINNTYTVYIKATINTDKLNNYQSLSIKNKAKIHNLEKSNGLLLKKLISLENKLNISIKKLNIAFKKNTSSKKVISLENEINHIINERIKMINKIEVNRKKIILYFEKGEIKNILNDFNTRYKNAKIDIEKNIIEYYKNNLQVKIVNINVIGNENETSDISFDVSYKIDIRPIEKILKKYFQVTYYKGETKKDTLITFMRIVNIGTWNQYEEYKKFQRMDKFSLKLYNWLLDKKELTISFSLGNYSKSCTVLPLISRGISASTTHFSKDVILFELNTQLKKEKTVLFTNVPNYLLDDIQAIEVDYLVNTFTGKFNNLCIENDPTRIDSGQRFRAFSGKNWRWEGLDFKK